MLGGMLGLDVSGESMAVIGEPWCLFADSWDELPDSAVRQVHAKTALTVALSWFEPGASRKSVAGPDLCRQVGRNPDFYAGLPASVLLCRLPVSFA